MLACNVSQRARRAAIAAAVAEITVAVDATATGNIVFAALVDDPASAGELVDAYLGAIMIEAANATDTLDFVGPVTSITWDTGTTANVTLSGGNLAVTNNSTAGETGARGPAASGKTSGKYYFEITITTIVGAGGGNTGIGVATTSSTYTGMGNNATAGAEVFANNGGIYANGGSTGFIGLGAFASGDVIGVAVDLDNRKAFFRKGAAGTWNGMVSHDPVTATGGGVIPAGTIAPICNFGGSAATTGNVFTGNFGASAFTGAVPSGYTSGWPV